MSNQFQSIQILDSIPLKYEDVDFLLQLILFAMDEAHGQGFMNVARILDEAALGVASVKGLVQSA